MLTFDEGLVPLRRLRQARPPRHRPDARRRRDRRGRRGERRGQVDAVPRRVRTGARLDRRRADRRRSRSMASRWPASRSTSSRRGSGSGSRTRPRNSPGVTGSVFEEVALGPMNLGLPARETVGADQGRARDPRHRGPRRARTAAAVRRPGAARGHRLAARDATGPPRPRRADRTARPGGHPAGRRRRCASWPRPARRCSSSNTRPTCSTALCSRVARGRRAAASRSTGPRARSSPTRGSRHGASSRRRGSGWPRR